jgi:hypothetical protein
VTDPGLRAPYPLRGGHGAGYAPPSVVGEPRPSLVRRVLRLLRRVSLRQVVTAATAAVVTLGTWQDFPGDRRYFNAETAPALRLFPTGIVDIDVVPGQFIEAGLIDFAPTAPLTVLDVRPLSTDPGLDLFAVRAVVMGNGETNGGYQAFNGSILSSCAEPQPVLGHGPTYPVAGMRLVPGDNLSVIFYFRATRPGPAKALGYRIVYRADGRVREVAGDESGLLSTVTDRDEPWGSHCDIDDGFLRPRPHYPL